MQAILEVHRKIRRALQAPLDAAAAAYASGPVPVQWKGIPFERAGLQHYLSVEIGMGPVIVHEIGSRPMMEGSGHVTIVIRSPIDKGEDANDKLLGIVTTAYPYGSTPTFEGLAVHIDKAGHRGYGEDGPWLTGLVSVDWNLYRRS